MNNEKDLKGLTCSVRVIPAREWHARVCGKPAKGFLKNGKPACGIHLRAEKKREDAAARIEEGVAYRGAFSVEIRKAQLAFVLSAYEVGRRTVIVDFDKLLEFLGKGK